MENKLARFGFGMPFADLEGGPLTGGSIARNAARIEAAGFSSIWTFDALGRGFLLPDPLTSLALAAAATQHVTLGTGIFQLPIRSMPDVASRVLTLANEIGDRLVLGVGPGSTAADFDLFEADYDTRFERFEHQLAELQSFLTTGESDGRQLAPGPPKARVTIGFAGWRGGWIERAASAHAPWIASGTHADDAALADGLARYRARGGPRAIVTNVQLADGVEAAAERARHLAELGFDDVVLADHTPSPDRFESLADALFRDR